MIIEEMKNYYRTRTIIRSGMKKRSILFAAFLISHFSFLVCPAGAQGFVSEIKIVAVQDPDSLAPQAVGYHGAGDEDLDFRKGKGGGYVFAVFKTSTDPKEYITDVKVTKRGDNYANPFKEGRMYYTPATFFQAKKHKDNLYAGGLNGRDYSIYGDPYNKQDHVYITHSDSLNFDQRVLKWAEVRSSKPTPGKNQTVSGGHGGGGRYFLFTWHTHQSQYKPLASEDINEHEHYCSYDGCKLTVQEPHRFDQRYGYDEWMQFTKEDKKYNCEEVHYKKCLDCGKVVTEAHKWATYSADWKQHNRRCLVCDFVTEAGHKQFGEQKLPVDEFNHMIYCGHCGFLKKLPHALEKRAVVSEDCEYVVVKYSCSQCFHEVYFEEPGVGHDYDANGFCTRKKCLHPYERPAVEHANGDSTYVVKTYGNLFWIADYVNNRRPKTNFRLNNDLYADSLVSLPWRPIGDSDSTAFAGTFDGGGHVITMLQTEEPVAGCGARGLFGAIAKGAVVKNVGIAGCNIRGWDNIGAVAGVNEGTIDGCKVVFSLMNSISSGKNLGGICGLNKGTITKCSTENNVWVGGVRDYAGGICGTNAGGTLSGNTFAAICGSGSDAVLPETAVQK